MLCGAEPGDADLREAQVGVASTQNETTLCNLSLDRLVTVAKEDVRTRGGHPLQFDTVSISDGIATGHRGVHCFLVSREIIADSIEAFTQTDPARHGR